MGGILGRERREELETARVLTLLRSFAVKGKKRKGGVDE